MSENREHRSGRDGWQRPWVRALTTVLTLGMMALIYCFSMENADASNETSGVFSMAVIRVVYPDYDQEPPGEKQKLFDDVQFVVRKIAHFTEFALLGLLMRFCLESWFGPKRRNSPLAWGLTTLYAALDEMHQLLIDGRASQWMDVAIDSGGGLLGVTLAAMIIRCSRRKDA